jgi:hypothetical protein
MGALRTRVTTTHLSVMLLSTSIRKPLSSVSVMLRECVNNDTAVAHSSLERLLVATFWT